MSKDPKPERRRKRNVATECTNPGLIGSNPEKIELTKEVARLIYKGLPYIDLVRYLQDKHQCAFRTAQRYVTTAKAFIAEHYRMNMAHLTEEIDANLQMLFVKAMEEKDLDVARKVLMDRAKLSGILRDKVEITSNLQAPGFGTVDHVVLRTRLRAELIEAQNVLKEANLEVRGDDLVSTVIDQE